MGSPENEFRRNRNETQHQVTISSFYMGIYLVTQKEYREIMGINPSRFRGDNLPVVLVSWYDAVEYCNWLSGQEGLTPAYIISEGRVTWNREANGYRLPTEAEWEYACRAGTTTPFNTGNNITTNQANYNGNYPYNNNAEGVYRRRTTPVGRFPANAWGLHDMHGNVWEWCWDWKGAYATGAQNNPSGAVSGEFRVLRGGSWFVVGEGLRSAYRSDYIPGIRIDHIGFRIVRP